MAAETITVAPQVMSPQVMAAMVSALGAISAAMVAAIYAVWEWHQKNSLERKRDRAIRATRRDNFVAAVQADLRSEIPSMERWFGEEHGPAELERFRSYVRGGHGLKMPQSASAPMLFEIEDFKTVLDVVPPPLMEKITAAYKLNATINTVLEKMAGGAYELLPADRQERLVEALFVLGERALVAMKEAVSAAETHLKEQEQAPRHPYSGAPVREF